ncbi:hypothetical protein COI89_18775, partial [Bacillus cereus]
MKKKFFSLALAGIIAGTGVVGVTGTTYAAQNDKIISSNISVNNKVNKVLLFEDFENGNIFTSDVLSEENGNHFLRTNAINYGTRTRERLQIPIVKGDTYVLKYDDRNHSGSYPMYVPDVTIDGVASVINLMDNPWRIPGDNWRHVELTFVA